MSISNRTALCERLGVNAALKLFCRVLNSGRGWLSAADVPREGVFEGKRRTSRTRQTGPTNGSQRHADCSHGAQSGAVPAGILAALAIVLVAFTSFAQQSNPPAATNDAPGTNAPSRNESNSPPVAPDSPRAEAAPSAAAPAPRGLDEAAFAIIAERNIFNANRSGGRVQGPTRRPARVETFTLVGTMAYEKGAFAFFDGSSSEFTKVIKAEGVIAGHKLADIYASGVKLEADGKQIDLPIGSQMRREDAGTWQMAEAPVNHSSSESSTYSSRRNGDSSSRRNGESSRRGGTTESTGKAPATAAPPAADQSEILKKLMERREKE